MPIVRTEKEIRDRIIKHSDPKGNWEIRYNEIWNTGFNYALLWVLGEELTPEQKKMKKLLESA